MNKRRPLVNDVQVATAKQFEVKPEALLSISHSPLLIRARWVSMYLSFQYCESTRSFIAKLHRRDHSTVGHALRALPALIASDPEISDNIAKIEASLSRDGFLLAPVNRYKNGTVIYEPLEQAS